MKISFSDYDFTDFIIKEGIFCGIPAKLIIPNDITVKFTQKNKIFRSSIWDLDGNLLSASFAKFTNFGENPDNFPVPTSLDNTNILTKIDGSTLIIDYVDRQLNMRTRGVFNYITQDNAKDFELVLQKYPAIEDFIKEYRQFSLIFEIVSPHQRIILNYGDEPDIYFIGAVYKDNYELARQKLLDVFAAEMMVKRPKYWNFPSTDEMIKSITDNKEIEGVCLYSNGDQNIHKCKTARYIILHKLKSELSSFDKIIDLYLVQNKPNFKDFYEFVLKTFDFELAEMVRENLEKCCMLGIWTQNVLDEIAKFVSNLDKSLGRKDAALKILTEYREKELDSFAFTFLSNKPIDNKLFKKLMEKLDK